MNIKVPEHRVCVSMSAFMSFFLRRGLERESIGVPMTLEMADCAQENILGFPVEPENDLDHLGMREQGQG